jgi:hypothetical protein
LILAARPSPIRDMIGEFLSVPRAAREVAEYIDRPVPVATGHLAAMRRLGLARRIGPNAYAAAGYDGPPLQFKRGGKRSRLRHELRSLLSMRSSLIGLRCKTGAPIDEIREVLRDLWLSGSVIGNDQNGYILKEASR